jgi:hypothetical protein
LAERRTVAESAEGRQKERTESGAGDERQDGRPPPEDRGDRAEARLSAKQLTEAAVSAVSDLTGYEAESVAGLQWDGESWLVTVDVLELERIPNTTDVLGSYVVQLDDSGELLGYKRTRRFLRSQLEED